MKKHGILNSHIFEVLSRMGHTDTIVIGDCDLPIPDETTRIDLSIKIGSPSFIETLQGERVLIPSLFHLKVMRFN